MDVSTIYPWIILRFPKCAFFKSCWHRGEIEQYTFIYVRRGADCHGVTIMAIWYYVSCWTSSQVSIDYRRDDPHVIIIIIIIIIIIFLVVIVVIIITSLLSSSSLLSLSSSSSSSRRRYSPLRMLTIGLKYDSVNTMKQIAIQYSLLLRIPQDFEIFYDRLGAGLSENVIVPILQGFQFSTCNLVGWSSVLWNRL